MQRCRPGLTALKGRLALLLVLLLSLVAGTVQAHSTGLSRGEYRVNGPAVSVSLVFSGTELAAALPEVDSDRDGVITVSEAARAAERIDAATTGAIVLQADGARCAPRFGSANVDADAVHVAAEFRCDHRPRALVIDCGFLDLFSSGHRHIATVFYGTQESSFVVVRAKPGILLDVSANARESAFSAMVWMGITHIWTGYDHLAFLFGLLLAGGSVRGLVGAISAFTVAHSITLALAALHVLALPPSFVEPAIALSVAYVGVENLVLPDARRRWRITFPFGLVHGFGFAGALAALDLPAARVPTALFAFNLGVELGQLAVVAVVFPILVRARSIDAFRTWGVRALSGALTLAGCVWFAQRVL